MLSKTTTPHPHQQNRQPTQHNTTWHDTTQYRQLKMGGMHYSSEQAQNRATSKQAVQAGEQASRQASKQAAF
jgi:hypothetical protein